ncbi:MAG: hypothetical protein ACR2GY_06090 [Phycisphaerales bacterium]
MLAGVRFRREDALKDLNASFAYMHEQTAEASPDELDSVARELRSANVRVNMHNQALSWLAQPCNCALQPLNIINVRTIFTNAKHIIEVLGQNLEVRDSVAQIGRGRHDEG